MEVIPGEKRRRAPPRWIHALALVVGSGGLSAAACSAFGDETPSGAADSGMDGTGGAQHWSSSFDDDPPELQWDGYSNLEGVQIVDARNDNPLSPPRVLHAEMPQSMDSGGGKFLRKA